jgi:prevent-host-death family protein
MKEIAVYEAKTRFSELLVEVGQGGQVVITRRGQPVARLVGVAGARRGASSQRQRVSGLSASLREQRKGVVLEGVVLEGDVRDPIAAGVGIAEAAV